MKLYRIAQAVSEITVDLSKYLASVKALLDKAVDFGFEENQRLARFKIDEASVINALNEVNYPKANEVALVLQSKDTDSIHKALMDIFAWYKENKQDHALWSKLSYAVKALNDYSAVLNGNQNVFTEEYCNKKLEELKNGTELKMQKIAKNIEAATGRTTWNGSRVIVEAIPLENDLIVQDSASVSIIGQGQTEAYPASFTYFEMDGQLELEDILEGGDTDFFSDNLVQADYFNLINSLRNPVANSEQPKILSLYTARPVKDRQVYADTKEIPSNIFLTNSYAFAEGFAREYGGNKDIWKIRIADKYLVKTMDDGKQRQYQVVGRGLVPIVSMELITPWST